MSILLIRHGETASNAARIVQTPETPLSERGWSQARALARRLADLGVGSIVASDLARARMTAECVREATSAPLELDALLQERNFGDHRGTAYSELEVDLFGPGYDPPAGESWDRFHARVDLAWERVARLAAETRGNLAVVTHGLVCQSIVTRLVSLPVEHDPRADAASGPSAAPHLFRFGNTALTVLGGPRPWRVEKLACTAHLDAADADDAQALSGI